MNETCKDCLLSVKCEDAQIGNEFSCNVKHGKDDCDYFINKKNIIVRKMWQCGKAIKWDKE